jgi:hypothetical protein
MVMARRHPDGPSRSRRVRRGAVTFSWLVLTGLVVVVVMVGVQRVAIQAHLRVELQNAADAMAHAAAAELADEVALAETGEARQGLMKAARRQARRYGALNRVAAHPVTLPDNPQNLPDGEIVLGGLDLTRPPADAFRAGDPARLSLHFPDLNAARVTIHRRGSRASGLVMADHDVIGFRPQRPILKTKVPQYDPPTTPLVPLAILSRLCENEPFGPDCWGRTADQSWEYNILAATGAKRVRDGTDDWRVDPQTGAVEKGADGLPEIDVVISEGDQGGDNAQAVRFDPAAPEVTTLLQTRRGLTSQDLALRQGALLLNDGQQSANATGLLRQSLSKDGLDGLAREFGGMLGQQRVWMLYSQVHKDENSGEKTVVVVGFVAARIVAVKSETKLDTSLDGKSLTYGRVVATLQPTVMNVPTAVTDHRLRALGPRPLYNPYIARVRIVE